MIDYFLFCKQVPLFIQLPLCLHLVHFKQTYSVHYISQTFDSNNVINICTKEGVS